MVAHVVATGGAHVSMEIVAKLFPAYMDVVAVVPIFALAIEVAVAKLAPGELEVGHIRVLTAQGFQPISDTEMCWVNSDKVALQLHAQPQCRNATEERAIFMGRGAACHATGHPECPDDIIAEMNIPAQETHTALFTIDVGRAKANRLATHALHSPSRVKSGPHSDIHHPTWIFDVGHLDACNLQTMLDRL